MAEYVPLYTQYPPVTFAWLKQETSELHAMHLYATRHDDVLVLDEMICRLLPLMHRLLQWDQAEDQLSQVRDSLAALNRTLKWAWMAREEETHAAGMYAGKLREAVAVLDDLAAFLQGQEEARSEHIVDEQQGSRPTGMTHEEAETLAATIKARLPLAEVEVREDEGRWVVEARNPRRGTSQIFQNPEQFEELMQAAVRH